MKVEVDFPTYKLDKCYDVPKGLPVTIKFGWFGWFSKIMIDKQSHINLKSEDTVNLHYYFRFFEE